MSQDNMYTHDQDRNWNATHKTGADDAGLKATGASSEMALGKGLDIGTANLAAAVPNGAILTWFSKAGR